MPESNYNKFKNLLWSKLKGKYNYKGGYIDFVRMIKEQGLYDAWLAKHGLKRAPKKSMKGAGLVSDDMLGSGLVAIEGMGLVEGSVEDLF